MSKSKKPQTQPPEMHSEMASPRSRIPTKALNGDLYDIDRRERVGPFCFSNRAF